MLRRAFLLLLVATLAPSTLRASSDPFFGKWRLDPSHSRLTDQMRVESVGPHKYGLIFSGDNVETVVADGTDQPALYGTTLAIIVQDASNWKIVRKADGHTTIMALWQLSRDGKTLTDNFTGYRNDSTTTNVHYIYQRISGRPVASGKSGFVGTWESNTVNVNSSVEIEITAFRDGGLSFTNSAAQMTQNLQFDGKEYPGSGPNVPPGYTCSGHRLNDRRLERIDKLDGKIVSTRKIEVSADDNILTMTVHKPGYDKPDILVFSRE